MVTYKFNRESRLLTPGHFQSVFSEPTRFGSRHFTLLITQSSKTSSVVQTDNNAIITANNRLGLAIAKKRVKLAVQRNRIKRQVRESFRLNQHKLPAIDIVVMVKSGIDQLDNKAINQELEKIWRKIIQRHKN